MGPTTGHHIHPLPLCHCLGVMKKWLIKPMFELKVSTPCHASNISNHFTEQWQRYWDHDDTGSRSEGKSIFHLANLSIKSV